MHATVKLAVIALAIAPCSVLAFSDFNGDGRSDVLWRNSYAGLENSRAPRQGTHSNSGPI